MHLYYFNTGIPVRVHTGGQLVILLSIYLTGRILNHYFQGQGYMPTKDGWMVANNHHGRLNLPWTDMILDCFSADRLSEFFTSKPYVGGTCRAIPYRSRQGWWQFSNFTRFTFSIDVELSFLSQILSLVRNSTASWRDKCYLSIGLVAKDTACLA